MVFQNLLPTSSPRRMTRNPRRPLRSAAMETLELRTLLSANITVLGGPFLSNLIADGSTTTSFPLYTDFGNNDINHTVETRDFYLFNSDAAGNSALTLTGNPIVAVSGDITDFSVSAQPTKTTYQPTPANNPTDFSLFTVQFLPRTAGPHSAVISIQTNDPAHPNFNFTVAGNGITPVTVTGGTEILTTQDGAGPAIQNNDIITVNYTGYLASPAPSSSSQPGVVVFDSSLNPGRQPFIVQIGAGSVIQGWEHGFPGMKVGQSATFIIPSAQGYGPGGNGSIPPDATLFFNVTVLQKVSPNFITKLYHDILGRDADTAGTESWTNQLTAGITPAVVTASFLNSTEYRTNRIQALYQTVFGRAADANGLAAWLSYLQDGNTIEQMESQFYGSTEFFNNNGATTDSVIDAMYVIFLNRHADADGLAVWRNQIDSGVPWSALALQLIQSTEGGQETVTRLYQQYLHREPDNSGLNYWASLLDAGQSESDVVAGFLSSPEYYSS